MIDSNKPAVSLSEWASFKGISLATAKGWAQSGRIEAWKSGRDWLIRPFESSPYDVLASECPPNCYESDCSAAGVCPCECGYCHEHCPDRIKISDEDNYDSIELNENETILSAHYRAVNVEMMLESDQIDVCIRLAAIPMNLSVKVERHRTPNEALELLFPIVHLLSRLDRSDFKILDNEAIIL